MRYLISSLANKGYNLYMDNFYISVRLAHQLIGEDWRTNVCGTMRKHRGEPDEIKKVTLKSMELGDRVVRHNGTVMVLAWKAKKAKIVKMLTSHHEDKMTWCTQKKAGHREPLLVEKPECVPHYNMGMNAVDCLDQNISYYPCMRKTTKWTKKFIVYLMQISVYNAYVIFKARTGSTIRHLDFLMRCCRAWTNWDGPHARYAPVPPPGGEGEGEREGELEMVAEEAEEGEQEAEEGDGAHGGEGARAARSPIVDPESRLDGRRMQHYLVPLPKPGNEALRRFCRVCKRRSAHEAAKKGPRRKKESVPRGRFQCKQCSVPLCVGFCDAVYHSKRHYWLYKPKP